MKIEVKATVTYTYELSDKEEEKLARIIRNVPDEFRYMTDNQKVAHAFEMLYASNDTDLYENDRTTMSDFRTDEFLYSEFNNIDAEDWLDNNKLRPEMYMEHKPISKNVCVSCGIKLDGNLKLCDKCASEIKF